MSLNSEAVLIKREILIRVAKGAWVDQLSALRRLPYEMTPTGQPRYRCCVHHERAILKDRTLAVLGYAIEDRDEGVDLGEAAVEAWNRDRPEAFPLTVVDEACKSCSASRYTVTNACMGCVARPCQTVCPKGCVTVIGNRATIDPDACVDCGKCHEACPYNAIIRLVIPCEEYCPVGAVTKGTDGKEKIDQDKCILCGRCVTTCPFGAVSEKSDLVRVIRMLRSEVPPVALVAPSVLGQFPGNLEQIYGAIRDLGFTSVLEVAKGAEQTALAEASEWSHAVGGEHQAFLATSCCPAWVKASRLIPGMADFVSTTPSPMVFSAREARLAYPDAPVVFLGPCTAKRWEALETGDVDAVLTFEELGALFASRDIEVSRAEPLELPASRPEGRGFALSGGVIKAVIATGVQGARPELVDGLTRKTLNLLKAYAKGKGHANLVEVMACEGGCIAGPGKACSVKVALSHWEKENLKDTVKTF